MSDDNNILPTDKGATRLPEDKLMAYLEGKLSANDQHEVEQWLADEGMESDAMEGLQSLNTEETKHTVNKLNHSLRKAIHNKKRKRRPLKINHMAWIAIVVILMFAVLAYIVIRKSV